MIKPSFLTALLTGYSILFLCTGIVYAQPVKEANLYPAVIPGSIPSPVKERVILLKGTRRVYNVNEPTLTKFEPATANGVSVIICPGGSYTRLSIDNEGALVAKALNEKGITAFVLKYRLPNDSSMDNKSMAPLQDLQEAIRNVRKNAAALQLDPARIGVMGFSAGGHLASTAAVHFSVQADQTTTDTSSARPDFVMLIYPVINFTGNLMHKESRDNLLGAAPSPEKTAFFSTDLQVTPSCPPAFLVHAADDASVPVQNSLRFYEACLTNKVPVEMHLYPAGGHGFGLENSATNDRWIERLFNWIDGLWERR